MAEYEEQPEAAPEAPEAPEPPAAPEAPQEAAEDAPEQPQGASDDASAQVRKLRDEAASYRVRAKDAEAQVAALQQQIFSLLVAADGRLADPGDLPYAEGLNDAESVAAAVSALLEAKPHYAARQPAALPEQSIDAQEAPAGPTFAELLRTL